MDSGGGPRQTISETLENAMHPVPLALILSIAGPLVAADRYLLPVAAGTGDGSSWANAAAVDDLEARWAALAPGDTLHLGSGTYAAKRTAIASGGEPGKPKTLVGHDTGGGLPVIAGTWTREKPAKGDDLFSFAKGVGHCVIRDLVIRAVRNAVVVPEGPVHDIAWSGLRISSVRSGFHLVGGGTPGQPDSGSTRLRIENCRMEGYTKRGLRLVGGNHQVQVVDCLADGGGKEWSVEPFPIGFMVQGDGDNSKEAGHGTPDHDITFERCEARNHYHDNGKGYWNADGFCAESRTFNLRYLACRASGNTDGGWDDKSRNPFLERCVATGNKRNFRFWTKEDGAMLKDCEASQAVKPGGSGGACGLWTRGMVTAIGCRFIGNPTAVTLEDGEGKVVLEGCTVEPAPGGQSWNAEHAAKIEVRPAAAR
jgi:hypothetical protein